MSIYQKLKGFYPELDRAIDIVPEDRAWRFLFTRRGEKMHVTCAIHVNSDDDIALFEKLCGFSLSKDIYETMNGRTPHIGVDLTALQDKSCRIYVHDINTTGSKEIEACGFYVNPQNGEVLGSKIYWRNHEAECFEVEYYDTEFNLIDENKEVFNTDQEFWNGPSEIVDLARSINARYTFSRKENKDQAYLIMGIKPQN